MRFFLVCIAMLLSLQGQAQDRIIDLHLNGEPLGPVPLFEHRKQLLLDSRDLPPGAIDESSLRELQRYSLVGCDACVMLSDLGSYT